MKNLTNEINSMFNEFETYEYSNEYWNNYNNQQ